MATHEEKAQALAEKITDKAASALASLEREMIVMKWPAEFRAIMWGAVVELASSHRAEAEKQR